jgi:hypothetical protein
MINRPVRSMCHPPQSALHILEGEGEGGGTGQECIVARFAYLVLGAVHTFSFLADLRGGSVRKIRLIEGNEKCRHLKKFTSKGTLRQVFICLRPRTPIPRLADWFIYCIQYTYSHREGGRGGRV